MLFSRLTNKTKTTNKSSVRVGGVSKNTKLKSSNPNKKKYIFLSALFAVVGGYFVYQSFAATPLLLADGEFTALTPARILDTRSANGVTTKTPIAATKSISVKVTGRGGVPATNVKAVVVNTSAVAPTASGTLVVWPSGTARPAIASLNFTASKGITNQLTVPVGSDGKIQVYNSSGNTHAVLDVAGYVSTKDGARGARYQAVAASRIFDSRNGIGGQKGILPAGKEIAVKATDMNGVPPVGVKAVVVTVTAVSPVATGTFIVWPSDVARPGVASLNFSAGQSISNQLTVPIGADGKVKLYNSSGGNVHVVFDIAGYYTNPETGYEKTQNGRIVTVAPTRRFDSRTDKSPIGSGSTLRGHYVSPNTANVGRFSGVIVNVSAVAPTSNGTFVLWPFGDTKPAVASVNFVANQGITNQLVIPQKEGYEGINIASTSSVPTNYVIDVVGYVMKDPAEVGLYNSTSIEQENQFYGGRYKAINFDFTMDGMPENFYKLRSSINIQNSIWTGDYGTGTRASPTITSNDKYQPIIRFTTGYTASNGYITNLPSENLYPGSISKTASNGDKYIEVPFTLAKGTKYTFEYQLEKDLEGRAGNWTKVSIKGANGVSYPLVRVYESASGIDTGFYASLYSRVSYLATCKSSEQLKYSIDNMVTDGIVQKLKSSTYFYDQVFGCPGVSSYENITPSSTSKVVINSLVPLAQRDTITPVVSVSNSGSKVLVSATDDKYITSIKADINGEKLLVFYDDYQVSNGDYYSDYDSRFLYSKAVKANFDLKSIFTPGTYKVRIVTTDNSNNSTETIQTVTF